MNILQTVGIIWAVAVLSIVWAVSFTSVSADNYEGIERSRPQISDEAKADFTAVKEEAKSQIERAVSTNDFDLFVSTHESVRSQLDVLRTEHAIQPGEKRQERIDARGELSDEEKTAKLQEKFEKLVDYYTENGELPNRSHRKGLRLGKRSQ